MSNQPRENNPAHAGREAFAGQRHGNYCTLPRIDVEILPGMLLCEHCRQEIVRVDVPWTTAAAGRGRRGAR